MRFINILTVLLFFICGLLPAQQIDWEATIEALGVFSSEESSPFWMYSNGHRELGETSNFSTTATVSGTFDINETSSLIGGTACYYRDEVETAFQRKTLFVQFDNSWLRVRVGAKEEREQAQGLSVSNKNFWLSSNARPLPGFLIEASNPLQLNETFALDWGIGHYQLNDDRYVQEGVRVHYKRLGLITKFSENHSLTARLQHFAQWAGVSPDFGQLPSDFSAFVDVFFARGAEEINVDGEIINAVGNHVGSYFLDYQFKTTAGDFSLYHEHPFEDGSGMGLSNVPDGIWGVYFQPQNKKIFKGVLYEFITTNDQSTGNISGADNYFSNSVYRSGWTYESVILGLPLIAVDPTREINSNNSPIVSNRVRAHHFGFTGNFHHIDWKVLSTVGKQLGTYNNPLPGPQRFWFNYLSLNYNSEQLGAFGLSLGLDSGDARSTTFGLAAGYRFEF